MAEVLPLPEIISGKRFEVRRSAGPNEAYIDLSSRQLVVPFDNEPHAVFVRAHETGHLRWTPLSGKSEVRADVAERTFQALEDLRINAGLRASGIRTDAVSPKPSHFPVTPGTEEIEVARCVAGLTGRAEEADYRARALAAGHTRAVEIADEIIAEVRAYESRGEVAPFEVTLRAAERMTDLIAGRAEPDPGPGEPGEGGGPGEGDSGPQSGEQGEPLPGDAQSEQGEGDPAEGGDAKPGDSTPEGSDPGEPNGTGEPSEPDPGTKEIRNGDLTAAWRPGDSSGPAKLPDLTKDEARDILAANINPNAGTAKPGTLIEIKPALTMTLRPPKLATGRRATDTGSIPANMARFACDSRIFRSTKPGRDGVAVLIDGSGSLALSEKNIRDILDETPASVIGLYYGASGSHPDVAKRGKTFGELVIVANGKRRVPSLEPWSRLQRGMGNNIVDLPALEWLARRKERRKLWISDGLVTGNGNRELRPEYLREIARVIRGGKIVRVASFADLREHAAELLNVHREVTYRADDGRFAAAVRYAGI